jgi:hypothetical protein
MSQSNNEPKSFSTIDGRMPISELFRPISSNMTLVDKDSNEWRQITATGYQRKCDSFFWPFNPTNTDNPYKQMPPSVDEWAISCATPLPAEGIIIISL